MYNISPWIMSTPNRRSLPPGQRPDKWYAGLSAITDYISDEDASDYDVDLYESDASSEDLDFTGHESKRAGHEESYGPQRRQKLNPADGPKLPPYTGKAKYPNLPPAYRRIPWVARYSSAGMNEPWLRNVLRACRICFTPEIKPQAVPKGNSTRKYTCYFAKPQHSNEYYESTLDELRSMALTWKLSGPTIHQRRDAQGVVRRAYRAHLQKTTSIPELKPVVTATVPPVHLNGQALRRQRRELARLMKSDALVLFSAVGDITTVSQLNGANGEVTGTDDHPSLGYTAKFYLVRNPWPYPFVKKAHWSRDTSVRASQLNGRNGEVTGSDDVKGKSRNPTGQKVLRKLVGPVLARGINRSTRALSNHAQEYRSRASKSRRAMNPQSVLLRSNKGGRSSQGPAIAQPVHLTECAAKFAAAIANPTSFQAQGACIPDMSARSSAKGMAFHRGTFQVGTQGIGFVTISPTIANDKAFIYHTTSAYTGSVSTELYAWEGPNTLRTGVSDIVLSNLPLSTSDVYNADMEGNTQGELNQMRLVSVGVKVFYTGTELNAGGTYECYTTPDHSSVERLTPGELGGKLECNFTRASESKTCTLSLHPVTTEECKYDRSERQAAQGGGDWTTVPAQVALLYPWSQSTALNTTKAAGSSIATICVMHPVPGVTFHYEVYCHYEFQGPMAEGRLTNNTTDKDGLDHVINAACRMPAMRITQENQGLTATQLMWKALGIVFAEGKPLAGQALRRALGL